MERAYADKAGEHAAELAYQYHRSAALPGAERGADHALAAVDRAEAAYAHDEAVSFLRIALELLPEDDTRRPRLMGRLGLALAWTLDFDEALKATGEAGELIAAAEGEDAAADYLAEAVRTMMVAGFQRGAWALASQGLGYAGDRRDPTWAWLMAMDLMRREAEDPDDPGIPLDTPERREVARVAERLPPDERPPFAYDYSSREDVLAHEGDEPAALLFWAGEYRRALALWQERAAEAEQQGQLANAVLSWSSVAGCHNALGDFERAQDAHSRGTALAARLAGPSVQALLLAAARWEMRLALNSDYQDSRAEIEATLQQPAAENNWAFAAIRAVAAFLYASLGRPEEALRWLGTVLAPLERAPVMAPNYTPMACLAAHTLWELERTDHIEVIERNLHEKVVGPDFRYPMQDGRLSLARLCALQGRYDEAVDWFAKARAVLDEQGARPLRAIVDFDEAQVYLRRAATGDPSTSLRGGNERATPLLDAALEQFRTLGMTGWIQRAESLLQG